MYAVRVSESFCCISINRDVYVCILALFKRSLNCSLMCVQGSLSSSFIKSLAIPLAFPFATTTSSSSIIDAAFSMSANQSSSLCPCFPSYVSISFNIDILSWCLRPLLFNEVFLVLLLLCINVLDRSLIPATSSLMSSDMLRVSLRALSSSPRRCLISSSWLAWLRL